MRPEAKADVGPEVAEDVARVELRVRGFEVGRADDDGTASAFWLARADDFEARLVAEVDQQRRLADRVLADAVDADSSSTMS